MGAAASISDSEKEYASRLLKDCELAADPDLTEAQVVSCRDAYNDVIGSPDEAYGALKTAFEGQVKEREAQRAAEAEAASAAEAEAAAAAAAAEAALPPLPDIVPLAPLDVPPLECTLGGLCDALDEAVYTHERWPLVCDPDGDAGRYLRYQRGAFLSVLDQKQVSPESMRAALVGCMSAGSMMILNLGSVCMELDVLCDRAGPTYLPPAAALLNRALLFERATWEPLLRPDKGDPEPNEFWPRADFRFLVLTSVGIGMHPPETGNQMRVIRCARPATQETKKEKGDGTEDEEDELASALGIDLVRRNSKAMVEAAFDGDMKGVQDWLDRGYDLESKDVHDHTCLSEAACNGQDEMLRFLLEQGADPNSQSDAGRTALYRAAFKGHLSTVQLLLEAGADPDISANGEMPWDVARGQDVKDLLKKKTAPAAAGEEEAKGGEKEGGQEEEEEAKPRLEAWDRRRTVKLRKERDEYIRKMAHSRVKSAAGRELLAREKIRDDLFSLVTAGEERPVMDRLETLCAEAEKLGRKARPQAHAEVRDPRGNTLLGVAAWKDRRSVALALLTAAEAIPERPIAGLEDKDWMRRRVFNTKPNSCDSKGWTPVAVAVFHSLKEMTLLLLEHGADPSRPNKFGLDAFKLARPSLYPRFKRWYDPELLAKDEAAAAANVGDMEILLDEWNRTKGPIAKQMAAAKAKAEADAALEKKSDASKKTSSSSVIKAKKGGSKATKAAANKKTKKGTTKGKTKGKKSKGSGKKKKS